MIRVWLLALVVVALLAFMFPWPLAVGLLVPLWAYGQARRRRARFDLRGPRDFTVEQRRVLHERDGGRCCYCGRAVHYESDCTTEGGCGTCFQADHVVAWSKGGPTTLRNGATSCRDGNLSKGDRDVLDWLADGGCEMATTGKRWRDAL